MITKKKTEGAVEYCISLLDAYVNTLNMEDGLEIFGALLYDRSDLINYLFGCLICRWIETEVNLDMIQEQVNNSYGQEIPLENIKQMLFTRVHVKAKRYADKRDELFRSRIPTFDMLTDKYGEQASAYLSRIFEYTEEHKNSFKKQFEEFKSSILSAK